MKQRKTAKPNPHMELSKAEELAMTQIIAENGALLRFIFGVDPRENLYAAGHFYAGVAAGIGITLKWKANAQEKKS